MLAVTVWAGKVPTPVIVAIGDSGLDDPPGAATGLHIAKELKMQAARARMPIPPMLDVLITVGERIPMNLLAKLDLITYVLGRSLTERMRSMLKMGYLKVFQHCRYEAWNFCVTVFTPYA